MIIAPLPEATHSSLERSPRETRKFSTPDYLPIRPRPAGKPAPLSLSQEEVWRREYMIAELPAFYNESITIHRHNRLDPAILAQSLTEIVRRHEIWRTTFDLIDDRPIQIVHPRPQSVSLPITNLGHFPPSEREGEALRVAQADARQPFDLKGGPLLRFQLISLSEDVHRLALTMHQSITDGLTVNTLFLTELVTFYEAISAGKTPSLPELPVQFADYCWWQRQWMQSEAFANQVGYWHRQLTPPLPDFSWSADFSRRGTYRGRIQPFSLPQSLSRALSAVSRANGVTLFMTLLASYSVLLLRYTGQEDFVVGTLAPAGRKRSEVQHLLGYFLNPVPLRINLRGNPTFRELLRRVRETVLEAIVNDDVPLNGRPRSEDRPLFDIVISLAPALSDLGPDWSQTFMDVESGGSRWPLYLELSERAAELTGRAQFNPDVFDTATITRMIDDWRSTLEHFADKPETRVRDASLPIANE